MNEELRRAIRADLERLGVDNVRSAMTAFDYGDRLNAKGCFLARTRIGYFPARDMLGPMSAVECMFEGWPCRGSDYPYRSPDAREGLRQECVVFLAERGAAEEASPVREAVCSG